MDYRSFIALIALVVLLGGFAVYAVRDKHPRRSDDYSRPATAEQHLLRGNSRFPSRNRHEVAVSTSRRATIPAGIAAEFGSQGKALQRCGKGVRREAIRAVRRLWGLSGGQ